MEANVDYEYETDYPNDCDDVWIERLVAPALYPGGVRLASNRAIFRHNLLVDSATATRCNIHRRSK